MIPQIPPQLNPILMGLVIRLGFLLRHAPNEFNSITTVIGFELPQLVINETLAVVTEDNSGTTTPTRDEYLFTWIELFNPWPDAIDPVDGNDGTALLNSSTNTPIFMLQINRMNAVTPDGTDSPPLPPVAIPPNPSNTNPPPNTALTAQNQFILFNETTSSVSANTYNSTPSADGGLVSSNLRVYGRNAGSVSSRPGYFVVGPSTTARTSMKTNTVFQYPSGLTNDYSAAACAFKWPGINAGSLEPQVDIRLYRLRNPFAPMQVDPTQPAYNPYITIDSVSQQLQNVASARPFTQRMIDTTNSNNATTNPVTPTTQQTGLYFIKDNSSGAQNMPRPTWINNSPTGGTVPGSYLSWQRRQPWHGYNGDWRPYLSSGSSVAHPFMGTLINSTTNQNLEGAFLGLPSLVNPLRYSTMTVTSPYTNLNVDNAMRQNGFTPVAQTFGAVNTNAYKRWENFPFLNRQLATPLELLSLRLYGSHLWFLKGNNTVTEWRLRFTDDCEFFPHPWTLDPSVMPGSSTNPFYERLWRTRPVPWYSDSRLTHPTFPQLSIRPRRRLILFLRRQHLPIRLKHRCPCRTCTGSSSLWSAVRE